MPPRTAFGQYLRARRALLRPEDVGLPTGSRRRVPGLRRDELALLAGISSNYYMRLEQGRDHHPSAQVVDALARALQLDTHAAAHLHAISQSIVARRPVQLSERAPASIEQLIASWSNTPAFVQNRYMDVLAANAMAAALSPALIPGVNLVQATFLDPAVRNMFRDFEPVARGAVARLRGLVGADIDDPRVGRLVDELSARSEHFRRLWARHDVHVPGIPTRTIDHPLVGVLTLHPETLEITATDGQLLIAYHADPGSASERALSRLADVAAGAEAGP
jgi:transcriptional regulator with XRE-family HTH domain